MIHNIIQSVVCHTNNCLLYVNTSTRLMCAVHAAIRFTSVNSMKVCMYSYECEVCSSIYNNNTAANSITTAVKYRVLSFSWKFEKIQRGGGHHTYRVPTAVDTGMHRCTPMFAKEAAAAAVPWPHTTAVTSAQSVRWNLEITRRVEIVHFIHVWSKASYSCKFEKIRRGGGHHTYRVQHQIPVCIGAHVSLRKRLLLCCHGPLRPVYNPCVEIWKFTRRVGMMHVIQVTHVVVGMIHDTSTHSSTRIYSTGETVKQLNNVTTFVLYEVYRP